MCANNNQTTPAPFAMAGSKANPLYPSAGSSSFVAPTTPVPPPAPAKSSSPQSPAPLGELPASDLPLPKKENLAPEAGTGEGHSEIKTTHYGYPDDPYMDKYTKAGKGKWGKLAGEESLALTDSMAEKLGVKPGDVIETTDDKGKVRKGVYIDRAPQDDHRIDIYDPSGSEKKGEPYKIVKARKVGGKDLASK